MNIPALLVLKSLENDDKEICKIFYPEMFDWWTIDGQRLSELKKVYETLRKKYGSYELYNLMEKCLIDVALSSNENKMIKELDLEKALVRDIRGLAMQLSRQKPSEWNKFLDVVVK